MSFYVIYTNLRKILSVSRCFSLTLTRLRLKCPDAIWARYGTITDVLGLCHSLQKVETI